MAKQIEFDKYEILQILELKHSDLQDWTRKRWKDFGDEILSRTVSKLSDYDSFCIDKGKEISYIKTAIQNTANTFFKTRNKLHQLPDEYSISVRPRIEPYVNEIVECLPKFDREVVALNLAGKSRRFIAECLLTSEGIVRGKINRVRKLIANGPLEHIEYEDISRFASHCSKNWSQVAKRIPNHVKYLLAEFDNHFDNRIVDDIFVALLNPDCTIHKLTHLSMSNEQQTRFLKKAMLKRICEYFTDGSAICCGLKSVSGKRKCYSTSILEAGDELFQFFFIGTELSDKSVAIIRQVVL